MRFWKIYCMEDEYPGLWHTWFTQQVAAVGWAGKWGFSLRGKGPADDGPWRRARSALLQMRIGDRLLVQLKHHRVGRVGTITGLQIEDTDWNPTVPPTREDPDGEQGRLVQVRWDLASGLFVPNTVVALPVSSRLPKGPATRRTVHELSASDFGAIEKATRDEENWVPVQLGFDRERWLSDHIAASPHELEPGLRPYPWASVREQVFDDRTRSDVLLLDREERPVVVECKQDAPILDNLRQLRGYMAKVDKLVRDRGHSHTVRGILVHGGPRRVHHEVRRAAAEEPPIELVRYVANVDFSRST